MIGKINTCAVRHIGRGDFSLHPLLFSRGPAIKGGTDDNQFDVQDDRQREKHHVNA